MAYEYVFSRVAAKDIQKVDSVIQKRLKQKLLCYINLPDPIASAKRLVNPKAGTYRWRMGDYRVVFDVDDDRIVILQVQHRREVYR